MTAATAQVMEDAVESEDQTAESSAGEMGTDGEVGLNGHYENGAPVANDVRSISETRELRGILEALLFMSADPLPMNRIVSLLGAVSKQEVEQALISLKHEYEQEGRGLHLAEIAGGYRILTKPDYAPWIKRLEKVKAPPQVVAFRTGVTRDHCVQAADRAGGDRTDPRGRNIRRVTNLARA